MAREREVKLIGLDKLIEENGRLADKNFPPSNGYHRLLMVTVGYRGLPYGYCTVTADGAWATERKDLEPLIKGPSNADLRLDSKKRTRRRTESRGWGQRDESPELSRERTKNAQS